MRKIVISGFLILTSFCAHAEIEKQAMLPLQQDQSCIRLVWWPKMISPQGWRHDKEASLRKAINILTPVGATFQNARTIIYGRALYKPRAPHLKSLDDFIAQDKREYEENASDVMIEDASPIVSKKGAKLPSIKYFRSQGGDFERVVYGEEDDFYILFVISAHTKESYDQDMIVFESIVQSYE